MEEENLEGRLILFFCGPNSYEILEVVNDTFLPPDVIQVAVILSEGKHARPLGRLCMVNRWAIQDLLISPLAEMLYREEIQKRREKELTDVGP